MKQYYKNPRIITEKQYHDLERWLKELGDLSGVVHDLNSDQIIGGNQRGRVFNINDCEIQMIEEYPEPDEQGTVGWGFVIWGGKKYNYRQVRWSDEMCERANLIANKAGGVFDFDILANQFEVPTLLASGFDRFELGMFNDIPSLDEMKKAAGESEESDLWPTIRIKVPPDLYQRFYEILASQPGNNEPEKLLALLQLIPA